MRTSTRAIEAHLRKIGRPFVRTTEARHACLFSDRRGPSRPLDFVIYSEDGANWLATCEPLSTPGARENMRKWQDIFGEGFQAAAIRRRRAGFVLVALDGTTATL
ncbi:MAG TPA: hypothetical protein VMY35_19220 [Phycisphaerae bacterium]|nr:hypothetical protein [Phycisphaerae bacterium]